MQSQTLNSTALASGPIVQNENAANGGPNVSIDVEQNQGIGSATGSSPSSGAGNVTFTQTNSLTAVAGTSASASQTQSSQATGSILAGGILGTVNQYSSTGLLTANANQTETQCEDAVNTAVLPSGFTCDNGATGELPPTPSSLTQTQYGPVGTTASPGANGERRLAKTGKDVSFQSGNNSGNTFTIVQHSTQKNDNPDQTQPNITQADCASQSGNCSANQTVNDGNTTSQNTTTGPTVDTTVNCASSCTTTTTNGTNMQGLIVGNTAADGNGPIQTYDLSTGAPVNSFVPDGAAIAGANGRAVAVVGGEVFYTELSNGTAFGPSDGIHVAPFNNGAGGHDLRTLPNPAPTRGIQDLTYAGGALYALTGYGPSDAKGPLQVWKLDPTSGAPIGAAITITGPDPDADGFTILPDGNFLINDGDGSCTYAEYNSSTGIATGNSFTVPASPSICTGVETDGSSLYFQTGFDSFTKTDLTGNVISTTNVAPNDGIEDVALG
jgi:hypothetical protein